MRRLTILLVLIATSTAGCSEDATTTSTPGMDPDGGIASGDGGTGGTVDGGPIELPPETPPSAPINTLEDQLRELGVDVDGERAADRRMDDSTVAPSEWAPLGGTVRLAPRELFLVGPEDGTWRDDDPSSPDVPGPRSMFVELYDESRGGMHPSTRYVRYEDGHRLPMMGRIPDNSGTRPGSQAARAAAAADFDGDGREEAVLVRVRSVPGGDYWLDGMVVEDDAEFTRWDLEIIKPMGNRPTDDLALVAGEMNGDATPDLLAVFLRGTNLGLLPLPGVGDGTIDQRAGASMNLTDIGATTGTRSVEIAQGNLDWDPELETVVLVRTWEANLVAGEPRGSVRWFLFDDFSADPLRQVLLAEGDLTLPGHDAPGAPDAVTAGVAISDFDGDGLDEIAFAGLTRVRLDCADNFYGVTIVDDLEHGRAPLASTSFAAPTHACTTGGTGTPGAIYEVFTHALEWDGDHPKELLVNDRVLDLVGTSLELRSNIGNILPERGEEPVSHASHAFATADVTHDGLDEVVVYSTYDGTVAIRGHRRESDGTVVPYILDLRYGSGEPRAPLVVPFDNDDDGQTLRSIPGSHRLELSEPLIQAVIAAPPCATVLGQDLSQCTTTYGSATGSGVESSRTTTGSVSATVGLVAGAGFGPFTFEASYQATMESWTSATTGSGYELTYAVDYTTMGRDAVVFTSVPYDVYEYEITNSATPGEIGERLAFMYPRRPITRPVSVSYFNERVRPGGLRIDSNVIAHIAGDPTSYLTREDMRTRQSAVSGRAPGEPFAFLSNGPRDVGASSTAVGVGIEVQTTRFVEDGYGTSRTHSVEITGGVVVAGVSVGSEESAAIRTTMSDTTSFYGSVPGIDDNLYGYAFGMFTYMGHAAGDDGVGQTFQVVDYWVE